MSLRMYFWLLWGFMGFSFWNLNNIIYQSTFDWQSKKYQLSLLPEGYGMQSQWLGQILCINQLKIMHASLVHSGFIMNFVVKLLFLYQLDNLLFLNFLRESQEVVLFSVFSTLEDLRPLRGDLRSYLSYYYDQDSSFYSISAFLLSCSCFRIDSYPSKYF